MNPRRTTDELFTALEAVQDDRAQDLIKELQVHQAELEIQNRELRATQQQLEQLITERTAELTSERRQREDAQRLLDNSTLYTKELEANRLKDEFLALVSHELRTPLTPILGAIYKLRASRADDEDLQTALDMIERNAKAQARIVEELLDISRITTGKLDFNRQPTDLLSIIESAIEVVRPSTRALGINLKTTLEPLPRLIWCDRDRIQQVIWNLLSNAIKFTSQGGTIEVRLYSSPGWAHIQISDSGVGITPGFLPHVFERFRQAGNFATRTHMGLGVGLSIVRYIVERHGGNVRADSRGEGHGATFVVDLPYS